MSTTYYAVRLSGYRIKTSQMPEDLDEECQRFDYYEKGEYTYFGKATKAEDDDVVALDNAAPFWTPKPLRDALAKYPDLNICQGTFLFVAWF
jgi:hypothetical protein